MTPDGGTPVDGAMLLAAACGAGVGLGLFLMLRAVFLPAGGANGDPGPSWADQVCVRWRALTGATGAGVSRRLLLAVAVGIVAGVFTRWPVAAFLAALGAWSLPTILLGDRTTAEKVARIEAIAVWTEMLRDTLASAAGLEQAITATAATAPEAIRDEVQTLAVRIDRGESLGSALRRLADELNDPTADLVVAALVLAAEHQARHLADLLASLADAARDQVSMRLRVSTGRARIRTTVRIIIGVTVAMAAGLALLNRAYLAPYDTVPGQVVLAGIGAVFTLALAWLARIARITDPPRVLTGWGGRP